MLFQKIMLRNVSFHWYRKKCMTIKRHIRVVNYTDSFSRHILYDKVKKCNLNIYFFGTKIFFLAYLWDKKSNKYCQKSHCECHKGVCLCKRKMKNIFIMVIGYLWKYKYNYHNEIKWSSEIWSSLIIFDEVNVIKIISLINKIIIIISKLIC